MPAAEAPEVIVLSDSTPAPSRRRGVIVVSSTPRSALLQSSPEIVEVGAKMAGADACKDLSSAFAAEDDEDAENFDANGDGIAVVGERAGVNALIDYPHFRFQCLNRAGHQRPNTRSSYCEKCFCYACDMPAAQCRVWKAHCLASDSSEMWRVYRRATLDARALESRRKKA